MLYFSTYIDNNDGDPQDILKIKYYNGGASFNFSMFVEKNKDKLIELKTFLMGKKGEWSWKFSEFSINAHYGSKIRVLCCAPTSLSSVCYQAFEGTMDISPEICKKLALELTQVCGL